MNQKPAARRAVIPADCKTLERIYDILARELGLPRHFGRNLDALHDSLTGDVAGPFEIVVEDVNALERALGTKGRALIETLRSAAGARRDATLTLRG
jgi:ribonuclease inhibitor